MAEEDNGVTTMEKNETALQSEGPQAQKYPTWSDLLALLGIFIVALVVAAFTVNILERSGSASHGFAVFISYVIQFLIVVLFAVVQKRMRAPDERPVFRFSFKKVNPAITLWGLIIVFATSLVIEPIVDFFPDAYIENISRLMGSGGWMMLTMLVMAPVLEEMLFRGIIQESLTRKFGAFRGILVSSAVFGIIHINPPQAVNAFFIGIMLGYIYYMTRSLVPVIFIHAVNNAIAYFSWMMNGEKMVSTAEMLPSRTAYYILYAVACVIFVIAFVSIYKAIKKQSVPL